MEQYYLVLLAFLGVIAVIDLFVGVSNDAVNFLNSALGCRISSFRTTLWVASIGVLAGATFSSGMMEIARSGVFHPQLFTFSELMIVFFAVMVADVILLDAFNSLGLPTSTTVSIVFELMGAAFAAALFKLIDAGAPLSDVADYINSSKSLGIVSGILISVVVAFISGAVVQYLARLVFTFKFEKAYRRIGAIYGGIALTAIIYFLVMKGAKGASFMRPEWIQWINANTAVILFSLMVAMGSSFADGAWDRESAVYRISGVLTVISGWFLTALSASSLAAVVAVLVFWGGEAAAIILGFGAIFLLVRSNLKTREDDVTLSDESRSVYDAAYVGQLLSKHVQKSLSETLRVLSRIHENFTADCERELTKVKASATDVFEDAIEARSVYYRMAAAEAAPSKADFDARYLYLRACTNTREVSRSLQNLAKLARDHVANRHRVGSNEITNDIGTLVADIRTLVNAREDHADVTALRNRAADVITRIEDLQRRLMEAQPRGSMTIRCCEFHLSYLLVLRELVNHYEIASLLEEQIDALARGAKAA